MKTENILGVNINDVSLEEAADVVVGWLRSAKKHYLVTPNPEFIMAAQQDPEFKQILNQADLAIPDGRGLRLSGKIKHTTTGIDLMEALCKISAEKHFTVGFLGGKQGVAKKAAERLRIRFPKLKIVFAEDGPEVGWNGQSLGVLSPSVSRVRPRSLRSLAVDARDLSFGATPRDFPSVDILFVGFGAVKQEKWITHNLDKLPVKVAIGVGGSFDYLSGKIMRAPVFVRKLGLEWLFRLILQPWRIKRQFILAKFVLLMALNVFKKT